MRGPGHGGLASILHKNVEQVRTRLISQRGRVTEAQHQAAGVEVVSRRRQVDGGQQGQEIRHVRVGQIELLAKPMVAELLVEFSASACVVDFRMEVEGSFQLNQDGRRCWKKLKVELAALQ